jgi:hypothetical protein
MHQMEYALTAFCQAPPKRRFLIDLLRGLMIRLHISSAHYLVTPWADSDVQKKLRKLHYFWLQMNQVSPQELSCESTEVG